MTNKKIPDKIKRFIVREKEGSAHGDLYELEITTTFSVIDTTNNKIVMNFTGEYSASLGDNGWDDGSYHGVTKVEISEDEKYAIVYKSGNNELEKIKLPE